MFRSKPRVISHIFGFFVAVYFLATIWSNFKPYTIQDWQVNTKDNDWHVSQTVSTDIENLNDTTISNIARYQSALIRKAEASGLRKEETSKDLLIAEQQGPHYKIPVYLKTGIKDDKAVIIIVYKYGLGLAGRLAGVKQFIPLSKEFVEQWVVMIQRNDNKVIYSSGTM